MEQIVHGPDCRIVFINLEVMKEITIELVNLQTLQRTVEHFTYRSEYKSDFGGSKESDYPCQELV